MSEALVMEAIRFQGRGEGLGVGLDRLRLERGGDDEEERPHEFSLGGGAAKSAVAAQSGRGVE